MLDEDDAGKGRRGPHALATRPIVPERGERGAAGPMILSALTLAEPHVRVPTSFVKFNNALAIFNEALTVQ